MTSIEKTMLNELKKWKLIKVDIDLLIFIISRCCYDISVGDYDYKKKSFIRLHYLKMLKQYVYLKFYPYNIKKLSSNKQLLCYFEPILLANGFDMENW